MASSSFTGFADPQGMKGFYELEVLGFPPIPQKDAERMGHGVVFASVETVGSRVMLPASSAAVGTVSEKVWPWRR
jgi:hypothetical protein